MKETSKAAAEVLSKPTQKKGKKGKKTVREMHVRKLHGGFHVRHEYEGDHASEEHLVPGMDELHDHIDQHMGGAAPTEAGTDCEAGETEE